MTLERQPEWKTLIEVISTLNGLSIPYMLTGSLAKTFYATPRMTRDIDIVIELNANDMDRVIGAFEKEFYVDRTLVQQAISEPGMFNIIHNRFHVKVDFIVRKNETFRREEFSRRKAFQLQELSAWVVSPEDLILSKLNWAKDSMSEMQLRDVKDLLENVKNLDQAYLDKWIDKLGVRHVFDKARS